MAGESLFSSEVRATLQGSAAITLDKFLGDAIPSSVQTKTVGNGSQMIVSSGATAGEVNLAITPPTVATTGSLTSGNNQELKFQLPANTGLASNSVGATDKTTAENYVKSVVDQYIKPTDTNPAAVAQKAAIIAAVTKALELVGAGGTLNVTIRNIDFFSSNGTGVPLHDGFTILDSDGSYQGIDSIVGANDILLDAGTSTGDQVFVINLAGLGTKTLALQNVEGAVLAASGTVKIEGSVPIRITSDTQAQNITGGGGNDTLVGTGSDTLTGGAGNDVFGFSGNGKYTITDFNKAGDMLAFNIAGMTNVDQLKAAVTSVVKTTTSITYNLGADTSITLVGVSASDLTAAMIKFTI